PVFFSLAPHDALPISVLQIVNITAPASDTFNFPAITLPAAPFTTENTTGHIEYAAGSVLSYGEDFNFMVITFTTATPPVTGVTNISFQNLPPAHETQLAEFGIPFTSNLQNTSVTITNCTPPTATITSSAPISICDGQPVGLTLSAATGVSPYDITVNGTTYTDVTVGTQFASIPFESSRLFPADPIPASQATNDKGAGSGM